MKHSVCIRKRLSEIIEQKKQEGFLSSVKKILNSTLPCRSRCITCVFNVNNIIIRMRGTVQVCGSCLNHTYVFDLINLSLILIFRFSDKQLRTLSIHNVPSACFESQVIKSPFFSFTLKSHNESIHLSGALKTKSQLQGSQFII